MLIGVWLKWWSVKILKLISIRICLNRKHDNLHVSVVVSRCILTTVDPKTGIITRKEPLDTLRRWESFKSHFTFWSWEVTFLINLIIVTGASKLFVQRQDLIIIIIIKLISFFKITECKRVGVTILVWAILVKFGDCGLEMIHEFLLFYSAFLWEFC